MGRTSSKTSDRPMASTTRGCASTTSASMKATSSTSATTSCASLTSADRAPAASGAGLLDAPVGGLPGVGPRTAARLAAAGLATIRDLLGHLPRGYDDVRRATTFADLPLVPQGRVVLVRGLVRRVRIFPRRLLDVYVAELGVGAPDGPVVRARWFRPPRGM